MSDSPQVARPDLVRDEVDVSAGRRVAVGREPLPVDRGGRLADVVAGEEARAVVVGAALQLVEKRPRLTMFDDFGGRVPSDKPPIKTPGELAIERGEEWPKPVPEPAFKAAIAAASRAAEAAAPQNGAVMIEWVTHRRLEMPSMVECPISSIRTLVRIVATMARKTVMRRGLPRKEMTKSIRPIEKRLCVLDFNSLLPPDTC